jgi:hypothetical protein
MAKRDGNYMAGILRQMEQVWKANPELRLAQLIANATHFRTGGFDCFYLEDGDLVQALQDYSFDASMGNTKGRKDK